MKSYVSIFQGKERLSKKQNEPQECVCMAYIRMTWAFWDNGELPVKSDLAIDSRRFLEDLEGHTQRWMRIIIKLVSTIPYNAYDHRSTRVLNTA